MKHYYPNYNIELKLYNNNKPTPHVELVVTDIKYRKPNAAYIEPKKWIPCEIRSISQDNKELETTKCNSHIHTCYKLNSVIDNVVIEYEDSGLETIIFPEYDWIEKPLIFKKWRGGDSMDLYWHTNGKLVENVNPNTKQDYLVAAPEDWSPMENMGEELYPYKTPLLYDSHQIYGYYHDPNVRYVISSMFIVNKDPSMGGFKEYLFEEK